MSSRSLKKKGPSSNISSSSSSSRSIPPPFTKPSPTLAPFLERLDPSRVYITHIDRYPTTAKQQIFLIPVLLNTTIALLLLWRAKAAFPTYQALVQTFLGYQSSATVDVGSTTRQQQIWILLRRTAMFIVDFLLVRFVGIWPLTFFLESPENPCSWRWKLGFKAEEVVVRVSRGWGTKELMEGVKRGEDNAFFKNRVLSAVERKWMRRTGYLLMDKNWDLEFEVMLDGHTLMERGELVGKEIDRVVWGYVEGEGWVMWRWEGEGDVDVIEERRKKVVALKERLTALKKESLFWRWMEIVEQERDTDGDFTPEQQKRVAERVRVEFEKEGVDFEELSKSVGGLETLKPKP